MQTRTRFAFAQLLVDLLLAKVAGCTEAAALLPSHVRDVADPWYTGDFEATYEDVRVSCAGLLRWLGY